MTLDLTTILNNIAGKDLETIREGLNAIRSADEKFSDEELQIITDGVGSLFFIDHYERPDLQPAIDEGIALLGEMGAGVIPLIMATFENSDMKANLCYAKVLGEIGVPAIPYLIKSYRESTDPFQKSYAIYALGKIKDKAILAVLNDVIEASGSHHLEVKDSAIRALGKTMELIGEKDISSSTRDTIFNQLWYSIADTHATIRAKTIRSLLKMGRSGLLTPEQHDKFMVACRRITGEEGRQVWDTAFIVRKEALEAMEEMAVTKS